MTGVKQSGDTVVKVIQPVTSSTIGGSHILYLHVKVNGTLTAVGFQNEILRAIVRPSCWCTGFLLEQDNAWLHVAKVGGQFLTHKGTDATDWPSHSPLNPFEHLWDVMYPCI